MLPLFWRMGPLAWIRLKVLRNVSPAPVLPPPLAQTAPVSSSVNKPVGRGKHLPFSALPLDLEGLEEKRKIHHTVTEVARGRLQNAHGTTVLTSGCAK